MRQATVPADNPRSPYTRLTFTLVKFLICLIRNRNNERARIAIPRFLYGITTIQSHASARNARRTIFLAYRQSKYYLILFLNCESSSTVKIVIKSLRR